MYVCTCGYVCMSAGVLKSQRRQIPRDGVKDSHEPPNVDSGNRTQVFHRTRESV